MTTNLILLILTISSFSAFMVCQSAVPGMNLFDVIQSRNRHPVIYAITLRNLYSFLITSIPVMLSLYLDYFFSSYRIPSTGNKAAAAFTVCLISLGIIIGIRSARKITAYWGQKVPVRLHRFPIAAYLLSRVLFIISYELYFRGFLLWYCLQFMNLPGAILINIIFYLVAHYRCNQQVFLGCIPMGLMLCLANYMANSILPAILIHLALTISYEVIIARKATLQIKPYTL